MLFVPCLPPFGIIFQYADHFRCLPCIPRDAGLGSGPVGRSVIGFRYDKVVGLARLAPSFMGSFHFKHLAIPISIFFFEIFLGSGHAPPSVGTGAGRRGQFSLFDGCLSD